MNAWEVMLATIVGLGLSAACGFRVFVPPLLMSIASLSGHLELAPGFEWIGSYPALTAFALATALEIAAYWVPWLAVLLDSIATPAATVAGIVIAASCISGMSPFLKWGLSVVAGGGLAFSFQSLSVLVRGTSTATTGGVANPIVSTAEGMASVTLSILAIFAPILCAVVVVGVLYLVTRKLIQKLRKRRLTMESDETREEGECMTSKEVLRRRSPVLALFLNTFAWGAGYLYCGRAWGAAILLPFELLVAVLGGIGPMSWIGRFILVFLGNLIGWHAYMMAETYNREMEALQSALVKTGESSSES